MIEFIVISILCSVTSAILYRAGGMSKETKHWIPVWMRHSWVRDWLCPICCLIPILIWSWWLLLAYVLLNAALRTYWDRLFGYDNFWFAGFMCGVAGFPLLFLGHNWILLAIRAVSICLFWGIICNIEDNDFVEEYSRGFFLCLPTIILLF